MIQQFRFEKYVFNEFDNYNLKFKRKKLAADPGVLAKKTILDL